VTMYSVFSLCTFLAIMGSTEASYTMIVGYEPHTDVRQHAFIDLDQQEMETHLKASDFNKAKQIYKLGGNSGAYAEVAVATLTASLAKGAVVTQAGNPRATGYVKSNVAIGATTLKVTYTSTCKVGGSSSPDTSGCYTTSGALTVGGVAIGQPTAVSNRYRTLAGFSTQAQAKMSGQEFYTAYRAYNQYHDYADRFVTAALDATGDFVGKENIFRVECAKKGSAYQNVWMYVVREMEDAIMDCQTGCLECNDDPVHAWDEAVAFYAGSLEGTAGDSSGKLLYRLAEKRCSNFGTCTSGDSSRAAVNVAIIDEFRLGQFALNNGRCVEAIPQKKRIVELMSVPLVQGAIRYAYKVDKLADKVNSGSKEKAEGVAFSMAILPRIAACSAQAAELINVNLGVNAASPMKDGFVKVKQAFESTYACMGITCADVGGLLSAEADGYYPTAEPCTTVLPQGFGSSNTSTSDKEEKIPVWLIVVLIVIGALLLIVTVVALLYRNQARKYQDLSKNGAAPKSGNTIGSPSV